MKVDVTNLGLYQIRLMPRLVVTTGQVTFMAGIEDHSSVQCDDALAVMLFF